MKTNYFLSLFLTTLILFSCADTQKKDAYSSSNTVKIENNDLLKSQNGSILQNSYEFYIYINDNNAEFILDIECRVHNTDSLRSPETYFLIEKYINTASFKDRQNSYIFSEIYRNFMPDWSLKSNNGINSEEKFFTNEITKGIYRVIFTCFTKNNFTAEISLKSNTKIDIFYSLEKAEEKLKQSAP
ncbi:MAG: hypothetical protein JW982_05315 [Spirochaetes bacterium]|nr:hypothetical protein [Spirochaetota bacterium]